MKRLVLISILITILVVLRAVPVTAGGNTGTRIQDGVIKYSVGHYLAGQPIKVGYDIFGYNYEAHMFKGSYANAYLGGYGFPPYKGDDAAYLSANPTAKNVWCWPWRNVQLLMKWNDAWISNMDRDGDGKLDRHYGFPTYIGSGAWETNHMSEKSWNDFVKIVAVPADAVKVAGIWYTADGVEIGPVIWGEFATIQEVYNEQHSEYHGILYNAPGPTGFGYYAP